MEMRSKWNDERLDAQFAHIDHRFDAVDDRFDRLETHLETRFDRLETRFDRLQGAMIVTLASLASLVATAAASQF